ncbi:MAG: hypothetical protein HKM05_04135 [Spirochaetales bacterium]|nr:hypothetical protein [Spirochaetales bacterium]
MRMLLVLMATLAFASCTGNKPVYLYHVTALKPSEADPRLDELFKHWPTNGPADDLVRVWNSWLGSQKTPFISGNHVTFVYYDFSHQASEVDLKANFQKDGPDKMIRFRQSPLFYKVYKIYAPEDVIYSFLVKQSGTTQNQLDPFNPFVSGNPPVNVVPNLRQTQTRLNHIAPELYPQLQGISLEVLLPPDYLRNLAASYPVLYLAEDSSSSVQGATDDWGQSFADSFTANTLKPMIVVKIPAHEVNSASFARDLSTFVKPWIDAHYRTLADPPNTILAGWGTADQPVRQAGRTDQGVVGRTWVSDEGPGSISLLIRALATLFPGAQP